MKLRGFGFLCVLALMAAASTADAWDFKMRGEYEFRTRAFFGWGDKDLFGNFASQQSAETGGFIGFAGPSVYNRGAKLTLAGPDASRGGVQITRGGFSQRNRSAKISETRLTLYPSIQVNSAVSVLAAINFGGYRHKYAMSRWDGDFVPFDGGTLRFNLMSGVPPYERYYMLGSSDAAFNTASLLSVEQLKAIMILPVCTVAVGTKNFPIGTGATYARNSREESIYAIVPYGPLSFHYYQFFTYPSGQRFPPELMNAIGLPDRWDLVKPDIDLLSLAFTGLFVQYHACALEVGLGGFYLYDKIPANVLLGQPRRNWTEEWAQALGWLKYNNGRFFFNGELALEEVTLIGSNAVRVGTVPPAPRYDMRGYHAFIETGVVLGPRKVSLMGAQASGRNLGVADNVRSRSYVVPINYQALEPYNYLMFHTYAGGNNQFNADGTGEMGDALALAVRGDYAVAANLNLFSSLMWARRLERDGYFAGAFGTIDDYKRKGVPPDNAPFGYGYGTAGNATGTAAQAWKQANSGSPAAGLNPFVNDNALGWEVVIGSSWQLLEGVTWNVRAARWQPGKWFDQAYKAFTSSPQGLDGNALMVGRDPILAVQTDVVVDF
ncbi:MAG: hypothetical protein AB1646_17595 [Thermodesulfobacteriota bacterium]